jgi:hypothetical protein
VPAPHPACITLAAVAMTRKGMRPVRQQGRAFYLTVLILTLLACYSFLRDYRHGNLVESQRLAVRSLEARDLEVRRS